MLTTWIMEFDIWILSCYEFINLSCYLEYDFLQRSQMRPSQAPDLPTREDSFCSIHCFLMSCGPSEILMTDNDDLQYCCRKGGPPSRAPWVGSCPTLGNELSGETHADKARDFTGKGHPGGEQEGKGTQENCSAT